MGNSIIDQQRDNKDFGMVQYARAPKSDKYNPVGTILNYQDQGIEGLFSEIQKMLGKDIRQIIK